MYSERDKEDVCFFVFKDGVVLQLTNDEEIHKFALVFMCFTLACYGKIKKENVRNNFLCKKVFSLLAHGKAMSHTRMFTKLYISREHIEMLIYLYFEETKKRSISDEAYYEESTF